MNRNWIRSALAMSGLALALSACKQKTDSAEAAGDSAAALGVTRPTAPDEQHGTLAGKLPSRAAEKRNDVRELRVAAGTPVELANAQTITSRSTRGGARISATAARAVYSSRGDTVIPAGAVFVGRVTSIRAAPNPGAAGTMTLAFDSVRIDTRTYPIEARVVSLATVMKGRGVTATDAEKTAAGAVIGGVAGRVIGGNRRGTIVGAATGAAAGAVIAHNTRDIDIVLPEGGVIRLELTQPFRRDLMARR